VVFPRGLPTGRSAISGSSLTFSASKARARDELFSTPIFPSASHYEVCDNFFLPYAFPTDKTHKVPSPQFYRLLQRISDIQTISSHLQYTRLI
jgi:hypothetical protein